MRSGLFVGLCMCHSRVIADSRSRDGLIVHSETSFETMRGPDGELTGEPRLSTPLSIHGRARFLVG